MTFSRFVRRVVDEIQGRPAPRRDDADDGIGVPVPTGPRPIRGGAQAKPPATRDEELESDLVLRG